MRGGLNHECPVQSDAGGWLSLDRHYRESRQRRPLHTLAEVYGDETPARLTLIVERLDGGAVIVPTRETIDPDIGVLVELPTHITEH